MSLLVHGSLRSGAGSGSEGWAARLDGGQFWEGGAPKTVRKEPLADFRTEISRTVVR